jgi:hypothetical protein
MDGGSRGLDPALARSPVRHASAGRAGRSQRALRIQAAGLRTRGRRVLRGAALAAALLGGPLLAACSSTAGAPAAPAAQAGPMRIDFVDHASKVRCTLINGTPEERTALYSERRPLEAATTKVSTDEVIQEVVRYFREQGYFELAQPGAAPAPGAAGARQTLEIETPEGQFHALLSNATRPEDARRFLACAKAFLEVYSNTLQFQSTERPAGWDAGRQAPPRRGG